MPMTNSSELWTPAETADYLKTSTNTLQNWRCLKQGPTFVKLGKMVRYRADVVQAWALGCEVAA